MLREYTTVFPVITDDVCEKLSKELKKLRNQSAHCDNRDDVVWDLLFKLTKFVEFIVLCDNLHDLRQSQEIFKNALKIVPSLTIRHSTEFFPNVMRTGGRRMIINFIFLPLVL
jgi:hypothetical protein